MEGDLRQPEQPFPSGRSVEQKAQLGAFSASLSQQVGFIQLLVKRGVLGVSQNQQSGFLFVCLSLFFVFQQRTQSWGSQCDQISCSRVILIYMYMYTNICLVPFIQRVIVSCAKSRLRLQGPSHRCQDVYVGCITELISACVNFTQCFSITFVLIDMYVLCVHMHHIHGGYLRDQRMLEPQNWSYRQM